MNGYDQWLTNAPSDTEPPCARCIHEDYEHEDGHGKCMIEACKCACLVTIEELDPRD